MYNNHITYSKKWSTPDNVGYNDRLQKYLYKTDCSSDCPLAWSKEVLELLETIDKRWGIAYGTRAYGGWKYGNFFIRLFVNPLRDLFMGVNPFIDLSRSVKLLFQLHYRIAYNFIFRPKVQIQQIKEKYGTFRLYYYVNDPYIDKWIEDEICVTEIKLAQKGAYVSLESLAESYTTTYNDFIHSSKEENYNAVKHFRHAELMKERFGIKIKVDPNAP